MPMKRYLSRLLALVVVAAIALVGCSGASAMTGNYQEDTLNLVSILRETIELPEDSPEKAAAQEEARELINEYASRYRRDSSVSQLSSFTTMRTALNSIAGHYTAYGTRPIPDQLEQRLEKEFNRVEAALNRGD